VASQRRAKLEVPQEHFQERLEYAEDIGRLIWKNGQCRGKPVGAVIKNKAGNEYRYFTLGYKGVNYNLFEHCVVWLLARGEWPEEIDHLDGDGLNNKLENLRNVTRSENNRNHRLSKNNKTTGVTGVRFYDKKSPLWQAYSYNTAEGKQIQLGNYKTLFDAVCARKSFELKNGYTERHGR